MFFMIGGVLLLIAAIVCIIIGLNTKKDGYRNEYGGLPYYIGSVVAVLIAIVLLFFSVVYTQDEGQAYVVKSASGNISKIDTDPGYGFKAPWDSLIQFDTRDQQAIYKLDGNSTADSEMVNGPEITIQDKDKVSANVDIAIRYSIDSSKLKDIYKSYPTQQILVERRIDQDMRSVVRNQFSQYTTAGVLEKRAELESSIADALRDRWKGSGVIVNDVALQGIRYPESTQNGFTKAQESATNLKKAQEDLKVKKAEGEQRKAEAEANAEVKRINAEAEAEANGIISESLSEEVLRQQYNETLKEIGNKGNLVVVPEGSTPMIDTGKSGK